MTRQLKRCMALILVVVLSAALIPQSSLAADVQFSYTIENGGARITDIPAGVKSVTIPAYIEDNYTRYEVTEVVLPNKGLTSLDVSACKALKSLNCSGNSLTSLVIGANDSLEYLDCSNNKLAGQLNVSNFSRLIWLDCSSNQLKWLTVNDSDTKIRPERIARIDASKNVLEAINISYCYQLEWLNLSVNKLKALSVSGLTKLRWLDLSKNCFATEATAKSVLSADQNTYISAHAYNCTPPGSDTCKTAHGFVYSPQFPMLSTFTDVEFTAWYAEQINSAVDKNIMKGYPDNTFKPDNPITRAEFVQVLYNLAGMPTVSGSSDFTDVAASDWYAKAVTWAVNKGVTSGRGNGIFAPSDPVLREEAVTFLCRYAQFKGDTRDFSGIKLTFKDATAISGWAEFFVKWSVGANIVAGYQDNTFRPSNKMTRAEAATILIKYAGDNQ
jgi:hypothetical protein